MNRRTGVFQIIVAILIANQCFAATITVDDDGPADYVTIQTAIDAAGVGDEIVVNDGLYTGPGNWNIDFKGKAITVRSQNGPEVTTMHSGGGQARGFYFHSGETPASVLQGFTIREGGLPAFNFGGGVHCEGASPTIIGCVITGNCAGGGGGLCCKYGASPVLKGCSITMNYGEGGGGMCFYDSSAPTLIDCSITRNYACGVGGGLHCSETYNTPTLINCRIAENDGESGGGIYCYMDSELILTNCEVVGNSNDGIHLLSSGVMLTNCTIADNGGFGVHNYQNWSAAVLENCIIWGNGADSFAGNTTANYSCIEGEEIWPGLDNINDDPLFVSNGVFDFTRRTSEGVPDFWGAGVTLPDFAIDSGNYRLQIASPCANNGNNNFLPSDLADLDGDGDTAEPIPFDLDGKPRVVDDIADMGAYEYSVVLEVVIDIKPGSYPNSINLGSYGLIPVAILSSTEFDATTVDPDTVELAGANVAVRGKSNKYMAHNEEVNGDDLTDLVLQVATQNLDPDSLQDGYATLTCKTYDGQDIKGEDEVTIVPPE